MNLYLVRGLPGSGKSTYAQKLGCFHVEADMYFVDDGVYTFNADLISNAHAWCFTIAKIAMDTAIDVVVSNTFVRRWEMQKYIDLAAELGADLHVIRMNHQYANTHNVPWHTVVRMRDQFEDFHGEVFE